MKIFIILGILAAVYLVYLSLTADTEPVKTQVEKPAVEEVSMPDKEFKNAIRLAAIIAVLIVLLGSAAFLL
jgi:threonine/homoserine/homoserine lactone efflux protein